MNDIQRNDIQKYLETCVDDGVFCGANVLVQYQQEPIFFCVGKKAIVPVEEKISLDTIYDLASLTKVVSTTLLVMKFIEEGKFQMSTLVSDILNDFPFADITIQDLLMHTSGLPADVPLPSKIDAEGIWKAICTCERLCERGKQVLYSDLGFITLGRIIEHCAQMSLASCFQIYLAQPLDLKDTCYVPAADVRKRCAPTEYRLDVQKMMRGEVHDRKANRMGGVSGHAGLFSTILDMQHVVDMLLGEGIYRGKRILTPASIAHFSKNYTPGMQISRSIGFLVKDERSPFASGNSARAYMHTGFSGTSLLIDPDCSLGIVILSNRIHPSRENDKILRYRKLIHEKIITILNKCK